MSIEAISWALGVDVGDSTRKLVLVGYANHAHKDGRNAWAGKETIAEYANCHLRTVRRHVQALLAAGWLREGDQNQVAHLRADRRPVVYDVAMNDTTRQLWADLHAAGGTSDDRTACPPARGARPDNVTPRYIDATGQPVPPPVEHGGTQPCPSRGDTALSPEPSTNQVLPPLPPAGGGSPPAATCPRPGPTPHANCRRCGTTSRQVAQRELKAAADNRRLRDAHARAVAQAAAAAARAPVGERSTEAETAIEQTRRRLRERAAG